MDLIYADANLIDQGVLQDYSFDMCYGDEDNTFEVKIQRYNPAMAGSNPITQDFILYVEFTEYGGIVDRVESDSKTGEITLKGRTWHGVMNGKVIEPPQYKAYRIYEGEANSVLAQMIADTGLGGLFEANSENSGIYIKSSEIRYERMYDCILRLFKEAHAKLYCSFYGTKVVIGAISAVNYAESEEFDSSQVPYKVGKTFNNINHMICLGQGDGANRAVIHLFADEDGELQPYKFVEYPSQDSDYILDKSQQKVFGKSEIAYIYDFPNAEITYNYFPLTEVTNWNGTYTKYYEKTKNSTTGELEYHKLEKIVGEKMVKMDNRPDDWYSGDSYKKYYYTNDGETFHNVEALPETPDKVKYEPTNGYPTEPWDWASNYTDYWYPVGTPEQGQPQQWAQVTEYKVESWEELTTPPLGWNGNYGNYYTRMWDGVQWVYSSVQPLVTYTYEPAKGQTKKPSDWKDNWRNYYTMVTEFLREYAGKDKKGNNVYALHAVSRWQTAGYAVDHKLAGYKLKKGVLEWKKNKFYTKVSHNNTPAFPGKVYNKIMVHGIQPFIPNYYYKKYLDVTPPWDTAHPNTVPPFYGYWKKEPNQEIIPDFAVGKFFYQVEDRYKVLIENALKKFDELVDTSSLDIDLELDASYDVGDIVGATDDLTGIPVNKMILRKIIKIKKGLVTIEYQVE